MNTWFKRSIANEPLLFLLLVIGPKKKKAEEGQKSDRTCISNWGYIPDLNKVGDLLLAIDCEGTQ